MKRTTLIAILSFCTVFLIAQDYPTMTSSPPTSSSNNAWEVGIHAGHIFAEGNIDFIPAYGAGLHIRRALDYVFSLRLDLLYGTPNGEDPGNIRSFSGTYMSGSIEALVSLNNLKWSSTERKNNFYGIAGIGLNSFESEVIENDVKTSKIDHDVSPHVTIGAGLSFRINQKVNISIEHQAQLILGSRSDLLDGVQTLSAPDERSTFRDPLHYTSVRINLNLIGKKQNRTEPLYWLNPLDNVLADLEKLKHNRVIMTDEDSDGIIDMLDEEEETAEGAIVDVKGVSQDSDGDGILNHEDKEPYSPIGYEINEEGVAQVPDLKAELMQMMEERLKNLEPTVKPDPEPAINSSAAAWFLPPIYFDANSSNIAINDYATLANVADVMKANKHLKFMVIGHTDEAGSEEYNNQLSYRRAQAVVDHLIERYKVSRNQMIIIWKGESENLVEGRFVVNRRVQLKVSTNNETEMAPPSNTQN